MLIDIFHLRYDEYAYIGTVDVSENETITQPIVTGALRETFQIIWGIWRTEGFPNISYVDYLLKYNTQNRPARFLTNETEDRRDGSFLENTQARPYVKID